MYIGHYYIAVESVVQLLEGFDMGAVCRLYSNNYDALAGRLGLGRFEMPLRWLAILILRSNPEAQLRCIISRFVDKRCFGALCEGNLRYLRPLSTGSAECELGSG